MHQASPLDQRLNSGVFGLLFCIAALLSLDPLGAAADGPADGLPVSLGVGCGELAGFGAATSGLCTGLSEGAGTKGAAALLPPGSTTIPGGVQPDRSNPAT